MAGVDVDSVKFCGVRLPRGVAGCHSPTEDNFARMVLNPPENTDKQEEKESGSVGIKLKRPLVIRNPVL